MGAGCAARLAALVGVLLGAGLWTSALSNAQGGHHEPSASELVGRDPGARVDGNTIVVTGNGEEVLGVPDRPNFIVALGSGDKITGGAKDNVLAALGENDTIVADRRHEVIVAGPRGTVLVTGSGHDLVVDSQPDVTIDLDSPGNEVIASGRDDRIVCSAASAHDKIYVNPSDAVNKTCHLEHDPVLPDSQAKAAVARVATVRGPVAHAASVSGNGSNSSPYIAPCDNAADVDCTVSSFASRTLSGFWTNEAVPAYRCPSDHPYLFGNGSSTYVPYGTSVPLGVEVQGLQSIAVSITGVLASGGRTVGTATAPYSSATNVNYYGRTSSYKVVLHCTSDPSHGVSPDYAHFNQQETVLNAG